MDCRLIACVPILLGLACFAGCGDAEPSDTPDAGSPGTLLACIDASDPPANGTPCAFDEACPVDHEPADEYDCSVATYRCIDGVVRSIVQAFVCDNECREPGVRPAAFPAMGTTPEGDAATALPKVCASSEGWGDCQEGTVSLRLLDGDDEPTAMVVLGFEDFGVTSAERDCELRPAAGGAVDCSFTGLVDYTGEACGGSESVARLCGELVVDAGGYQFTTSITLDVVQTSTCF